MEIFIQGVREHILKNQGVQGAKNIKNYWSKNMKKLNLVCKAGILDCLYLVVENYSEVEVLHNILCLKIINLE